MPLQSSGAAPEGEGAAAEAACSFLLISSMNRSALRAASSASSFADAPSGCGTSPYPSEATGTGEGGAAPSAGAP